MIAEHRRHTGCHVDEGNGQEQLPDQVLHRLEGRYRGELVEEAEPQGQGDELDRLLEHRRHEEAQPVAAPARRVGQNPQPQRNRGQGQQDVDEGQAQHHLHDHVEDEEAVDQVEQGQYLGHAHAPGLHRGEKGVEGSPEQVSGRDAQGDGDEAGHGVGHVQDQGAPPERRCGGHQAEHQARHHLPPARLLSAQVLGHDEAQPHPAQDDDEGARRDGPDDQPRLAHHLVGVGEVGRGAGEDVAHGPDVLRQLSASSPDARSTTPQSVPWTPSMTQPAKAFAQRAGLRAARTLSQILPGWWMGTTA